MSSGKITHISGNWKMHKTVAESVDFCRELQESVSESGNCRVSIFAPYTALATLKEKRPEWLAIGAQNMHNEEKGAFTGEISPVMLVELVDRVLIGHSERRHIFGEKAELLALKLRSALKWKLKVTFCVGETLQERKEGRTLEVLEEQIRSAFDTLPPDEITAVALAYEPVWAIGTGINATCFQAEEAHKFIKELFRKAYRKEITVLYGGSVKPANSNELLSSPSIDGLLIGGASLQVSDFSAIISSAQKL